MKTIPLEDAVLLSLLGRINRKTLIQREEELIGKFTSDDARELGKDIIKNRKLSFMNTDKLVHTEQFNFSPKENGGEALILQIKYYAHGLKEKEIYTNQELILNSYCNSATFNLSGIQFTPEKLRELANLLEITENKVNAKVNASSI